VVAFRRDPTYLGEALCRSASGCVTTHIEISLNDTVLEQRLAELEASRSWSPRTVSKLESLIRSGEDFDLFRINPYRFAAESGLDETEAVDLLLHATRAGLLELPLSLQPGGQAPADRDDAADLVSPGSGW